MQKRWLKILLIILLAIGLLLTAWLSYAPTGGDYVLDRNLYQIVAARPDYVKLDQVSPIFLDVLVANEDKRFYRHGGFDVVRIGGALVGNIRAGQLEAGGSTITQQLAKNLFYSSEQTLVRKVLELSTALRLEHYFSKRQILEMYINVIYYGSDAYGIAQASRVYFDKKPNQLSLDDATMLAGLLPAPSVYNPKHNLALAKQRQAEALDKYLELSTGTDQ